MSWDYFNKFDRVSDIYLPLMGGGDTRATQIVTAVNKLVYKWFNDGDVYDNVNSPMQGWMNDLSSYANWLFKYATPTLKDTSVADILYGIKDCFSTDDYEALLTKLADALLDEEWLEDMSRFPSVGSIYNCDGPFEWSDYVEDDDYEDEEEEW